MLSATCILIGLLPVPAHASSDLEVTVSTDRFDTVLGVSETLEVEITNTGASPTGLLVGHLLVIDPDSSVSADAEDWTDELTRPLGSLPPETSVTFLWEVQPITTGEFLVMVAVAPVDPGRNPTISPSVLFSITRAEASLGGSVFVVAFGVPLLLLLLALRTRQMERRRLTALSLG